MNNHYSRSTELASGNLLPDKCYNSLGNIKIANDELKSSSPSQQGVNIRLISAGVTDGDSQ